jgi:hypothetical protein
VTNDVCVPFVPLENGHEDEIRSIGLPGHVAPVCQGAFESETLSWLSSEFPLESLEMGVEVLVWGTRAIRYQEDTARQYCRTSLPSSRSTLNVSRKIDH